MQKIIIALDSFKGSLSSMRAGNALSQGIKQANNNIQTIVYAVADGGEGTVDALHKNCGGTIQHISVKDPLFRDIQAQYLELTDKTAVIEMASASGLPLVEESLRNPLNTTTYGTGELIKHALDRGTKKIILAIGGSATNDAAIGVFSALGVKFLNQNQEELSPIGGNLNKIHSIDLSFIHPKIKDCEFIVACDVNNPLYGENGAAYIYAPQKGANDEMVQELDQGLKHFAQIIKQQLNKDIAQIAGAGAAGGMGAGLLAFTNATLRSGIDIVLDQIGIDLQLKDTDLVFVGEGRLDKQTAMGKAPMGIAKRAAQHDIPVIAIGGGIEGDPTLLHEHGIHAYFATTSRPMSLEQAMSEDETIKGLIRQGRELTKLLMINKKRAN